jgi:hypothetical protein
MSINFDILRRFRVRTAAAPSMRPSIHLAVYQARLIHLGAGRHTLLNESDDFQHYLDPQQLAKAARHLLPDSGTEHGIALFLPAHEFAATQVTMPGVAAENLANAVRLQQPMLLPGLTDALLLAIQAPSTPKTHYIALWLSAGRAEKLFHAFAREGLFLSHILPRPLALVHNDTLSAQALLDVDDSTLTYFKWEDGSLSQWLYITHEDYAQDAFRTQFDQVAAVENADTQTQAQRWENLPYPSPTVFGYALTPTSALLELRRRRKTNLWRQGKIIAALVSVLLLLSMAILWMGMQRLENQLNKLKEQTAEVSRLRAEIIAIEETIGPVIHFPSQDVIAILLKLNQIIPKDSWISAFKISDGLVEIEGSSNNPTDLLETLIQDPSFAEVTFSRPTQGDRFGIKFRLVGVDVPAYLQEYFPP